MAHFQTGDCICYRKGGPTYWVRSVLEDGRVVVSKDNGRTKLITRPEEYVRIAQRERACGGPSVAQRTQKMVLGAREACTFVIDKQRYLDGRNRFTIMRIRENRLDLISKHEMAEQAMEAAHRYASQARFAGLDARIFQRD